MNRREFLSYLAYLGYSSALVSGALFPKAFCASDSQKHGNAFVEHDSFWVELMQPLMGSYVAIAIYHPNVEDAHRIITDCFSHVRHEIGKISEWDPKSDVTKLNSQRWISLSESSEMLRQLLNLSTRVLSLVPYQTFSPLDEPLTRLWREAKIAKSRPDANCLKHTLAAVRQSRLEIKENTAQLHGNGGIDTGGFGKGFIAELGCAYLKRRGIRFARIACSGDLYLLGNTKWLVEVEDPRSEDLLGVLQLQGDWGVSTSGDYRNSWFVGNKRFHHLIDPRTGLPGTACQQVTVVHPRAGVADALATALFFLNVEQIHTIVKSIPQAFAIVVDARHGIYCSRGLSFEARANVTWM